MPGLENKTVYEATTGYMETIRNRLLALPPAPEGFGK
jgi:hypothetical protein